MYINNVTEYGYKTGMVGKYHLHEDTMQTEMDSVLYSKYVNDIMKNGFDFADGIYIGNIYTGNDMQFSHNPEWMVSKSIDFINETVNVHNSPFFLYFSLTLGMSTYIYNICCFYIFQSGCNIT